MGSKIGGGENHRFALYDMIMLKTITMILLEVITITKLKFFRSK
jgi:nicotinate-nucleotide pyrophosphorylase